jgi:hypothetical protein
MRRHVCAIAFLLVLASGLGMPQAATGPDVPSKQDVLRLLDLLQVKARMVQMLDGFKSGMKAGAEAGLKQHLPNATPEQVAKVDALADAVLQDIPVDEMMEAMIPIYQRHLTKTDLDSIIAFYSSPAGQRLLKEQPAMMAEGMKAGQDIMLKRIPVLTQRLNTQVAQLAKEAQKDPATPTNK